jgi:NhaP-type Na+/H+ or K+/H+ antiporter
MTPIAVFVVLLLLFGLVSRRLQQTIVTGPMIFTLAGILVVFALPELQRVDVEHALEPVLLIGEVTLALVLFSDATRIRVRTLLLGGALPARILGIGMPLVIVTGTVAGMLLLPELLLWEAAILAVVLAPTDLGLGEAVVKNPLVPARIRQALNVEGGLNDGISMPFLMLFIGLARTDQSSLGDFAWVSYTLQQVGFGIMVGVAVGWLGGWLLHQADKRNWITEHFQQIVLLCLALIAWHSTESIGGNGFIAAFVAGLLVKVSFKGAIERMVDFNEEWGTLLAFLVFYLFGMLAAPDLGHFGVAIILFAVLSLTVVRMLPVAVALAGTHLRPVSVLFIGWFGPRGLSSVVLGLIYLKEEAHLPSEDVIILAVVATVLLSIFAHGISAAPLAAWYAGKVEDMDASAPERLAVAPVPD